jgi:hypothetical protein
VGSDKIIELNVTGSSFRTIYADTPFNYTGRVFVDWGDDTLVEYTGGMLTHNYTSTGNYTVKIYGNISSLGTYCFQSCTGLTSITIPYNVTSIGSRCFYGCTGLTEIVLEWDSASEIVSYLSNWINGASSFNHFLIPTGTTSLYTAKGYPSNKLVERTS